MMKYLFLLIALFTPILIYGQVDSTYIGFYEKQFGVKTFVSKDFVNMAQEISGEEEKVFLPNNPVSIGLGISIYNSVINVGYGYGFDFMRDKNRGKTKSFDFQYHYYGRKFVFDVTAQRYRGFYLDDTDSKSDEIVLYPDMSIRMYGLHGLYIFNNDKFSYRATFNQSEKQLKSTGTILVGGGIYTTKIASDSSFMHNGRSTLRNFQFGVSAGYAYNWVLGRYWYISGSTTVGINFGSEKLSTFGKEKIKVTPSVFPRISMGYNRSNWALSFSYVNNILFESLNDDNSLSIFSGSFQMSYTKRFNVGKNEDRLNKITRSKLLRILDPGL